MDNSLRSRQSEGPVSTPRRAVFILLAAQVLLGLLYSLSTPIFEASDEIWHYPVVREIVVNRRLPVQDRAIDARWAQEGSQPPLYYGLGALLTGWIDTSDYERTADLNPFAKIGIPLAADNHNLVAHPPDQSPLDGGTVLAVTLIRWLSVLMGTATAYLAFRLALTLYPTRPAVGFLAAGLVAFNPMVLFINASVNNDNLLMLLSGLALWLMVLDLKSRDAGPRWRDTVLLGLVIGLASITKVSGLVLAPVAALGITFSAWQQRSWQTWLVRGLTLGLVLSVIAGWWYARNVGLYGELTGLQRMVEVAGPRPAGFGLAGLVKEWQSFWYSYWGVFGAFNVLAPSWFFTLAGALTLVSGAGLVKTAIMKLARRQRLADWPSHLLLLSFIALTFIGLIRWTLMTMASQGRLMFGAIVPISLYLALGLLAWFPKGWRLGAAYGLAVVLAACAVVIPFASIRPAYRLPVPQDGLPNSAIALNIQCGESIQLAGYDPPAAPVQAGEPLEVTLYWRTSRPIDADLQLSLNGYGFKQENVAKLDTWPGGGLLPTSIWQPGALYADRTLIPTQPNSSTPILVKLGVSWNTDLFDPTSNRPVPCVVDGTPVDAVFLDAGALVGKLPSQAEPPALPIARLQQGIRLDRYELAQQPNKLILTLTWSATEPIPADYQVFAHIFDGAGNKIAQGDGPPREGFWPTSYWRTREPVTSTHTIELPRDFSLEQGTLGVGLYDPATGQRLAAFDAQGQELLNWMIVLSSPDDPS